MRWLVFLTAVSGAVTLQTVGAEGEEEAPRRSRRALLPTLLRLVAPHAHALQRVSGLATIKTRIPRAVVEEHLESLFRAVPPAGYEWGLTWPKSDAEGESAGSIEDDRRSDRLTKDVGVQMNIGSSQRWMDPGPQWGGPSYRPQQPQQWDQAGRYRQNDVSVNWPMAGEERPPSEVTGLIPPEVQAGGASPAGSHYVNAQRFQVEMPEDVYAEVQRAPESELSRARLHALERTLSAQMASDAPGAANTFYAYQAFAAEERERGLRASAQALEKYMGIGDRWGTLAQLRSFQNYQCRQEVYDMPTFPENSAYWMEEYSRKYFNDLYAAHERADASFHARLGEVFMAFKYARDPEDLGLSSQMYRFTVHGLGQRPEMIRGPLKTKERAREKVNSFAKRVPEWPPASSKLYDIIRATAIFDDPYELVMFLKFAERTFPVVRIQNRFQGLYKRGDQMPVAPNFRSVKANLVYTHEGRKLIVELQLTLRAVWQAELSTHNAYEVVRATEPREVCGPPWRWAPDRPARPGSPREDWRATAAELMTTYDDWENTYGSQTSLLEAEDGAPEP